MFCRLWVPMAAVFDLLLAPPRAVSVRTRSAHEAWPVPGGGSTVFGCVVSPPLPPQLEPMMREADQTPCAPALRHTTPQEATDPARCCALTTHRCHDALASGVYGLACRGPHVRRPPLLRCGGHVAP